MKANDFKLLLGSILQVFFLIVVVNAVHPRGTTGLLICLALLVGAEFLVYREVQSLRSVRPQSVAAPDSVRPEALRPVPAPSAESDPDI